jgi:hypothetical protein
MPNFIFQFYKTINIVSGFRNFFNVTVWFFELWSNISLLEMHAIFYSIAFIYADLSLI